MTEPPNMIYKLAGSDQEIDLTKIDTPPAVLLYAHAVYNRFLELAKVETVRIPLTDDEIEIPVFRGRIGDVFDAVVSSRSYYSQIRAILDESGSLTVLERGTAHTGTVLAVNPNKPPPLELPPSFVKSSLDTLTLAREVATLKEQVEKLAARLGEVNIVKILRDFEIRISRIEGNKNEKIETGD